jgi:hypothetical protein
VRIQCCVYKKYRIDGKWVIQPDIEGALVSHSLCPDCYDTEMTSLMRKDHDDNTN